MNGSEIYPLTMSRPPFQAPSPGEQKLDEWNLLKEQFHALVAVRSDNIEDILDPEFSRRLSECISLAANGRESWR
ncbi:MAG TPA: hypothetical protein VEI95_13765 [Acidobacteriota bacterium]|nr:hypothetical protein [Acidobacteriota bacterium]